MQVFHVDMCTPGFKAQVFRYVPRQAKFKAIRRALTLRDAEETISEAVADPDTFGYGRLYILFLEHSKQQIAKIFYVLANEDNYPLLMHCIHGCAPPAPTSRRPRQRRTTKLQSDVREAVAVVGGVTAMLALSHRSRAATAPAQPPPPRPPMGHG